MPQRSRLTPAGLVKMLLVGAIVGSLFDGFHTHGGATSYPHPVFLMMAWWTPPLFAFAYTLLGLGYRLGHQELPDSPPVARFLIFGALYFASGYLPASNVVKLLVLLGGGLALWLMGDRSVGTLALGVAGAFAGPVTEIILVHFGAFSHLQPDFAGIPMWLPALYFASAGGAAPFMAWLTRDAVRSHVAKASRE